MELVKELTQLEKQQEKIEILPNENTQAEAVQVKVDNKSSEKASNEKTQSEVKNTTNEETFVMYSEEEEDNRHEDPQGDYEDHEEIKDDKEHNNQSLDIVSVDTSMVTKDVDFKFKSSHKDHVTVKSRYKDEEDNNIDEQESLISQLTK